MQWPRIRSCVDFFIYPNPMRATEPGALLACFQVFIVVVICQVFAVYLKSLKLVGFKSFADRTRLEFRPGVTVVVGPNGSGTSNLVSALSWVVWGPNRQRRCARERWRTSLRRHCHSTPH